jgi:hypothetical protein
MHRIKSSLTSPQARVSILLLLLVLIQAGVFIRATIVPTATELQEWRGQPAVVRSAGIAFGDRFAGYVEMLRERIPDQAVVLIPRLNTHEVIGHEGLMQYYLYPRTISNCPRYQPVDVCIQLQQGARTYILHIETFPPSGLVDRSMRYEAFDEAWGVYIPESNGG